MMNEYHVVVQVHFEFDLIVVEVVEFVQLYYVDLHHIHHHHQLQNISIYLYINHHTKTKQ